MQEEIRQQARHWQNRGRLVHRFYRQTGRYRTIRRYIWRLLWTLTVFSTILYAVHAYLWDVETITDYFLGRFSAPVLYLSFFLSESIMGLLPPDLFILWAQSLAHPYQAIAFLALLSYLGGVVSWWEGRFLRRWPWLQRKILTRYGNYLAEIRRYGTLLIVLSAMTPLPFSPISVVAGLSDFSLTKYALAALVRFVRFFVYAVLFFGLIT